MAAEAGAEVEVIVLSRADFGRVLAVLENPPEPNARLLELAARYNRAVDEGRVGPRG